MKGVCKGSFKGACKGSFKGSGVPLRAPFRVLGFLASKHRRLPRTSLLEHWNQPKSKVFGFRAQGDALRRPAWGLVGL